MMYDHFVLDFRTTKQILSLEQRLLKVAQEELNETWKTIEADRVKISALQQEQSFTARQIKDALSKGRPAYIANIPAIWDKANNFHLRM